MDEVAISSERIGLAQFLKWAGLAPTGGQARALIAGGEVTVNGRRELRAKYQLVAGDRVQVGGGKTIAVVRRSGED